MPDRVPVPAKTTHHAKTNKVAKEVEMLTACGLTDEEISYCLSIDLVTLKTMYSEEIRFGTARIIGKIGMQQIRQALKGDTNAAQFILRSRGRWVTPTKVESDVSVTIQDRRKLMDEIVQLVTSGRVPVTIEHQKLLEDAKPQGAPS